MKVFKIILTVGFVVGFINFGAAQTSISLTEINGVYKVPCTLNGKATNFIFDTGASVLTISLKFYNSAISNGILRESDILPEVVNFEIANGDVVEGRMLNIRSFKLGELELSNVLATIIESQSVDMLLGQTVLQKFGSYTIDNNKMELIVNEMGNEVVGDIEADFIEMGKRLGADKARSLLTYKGFIDGAKRGLSFCRNLSIEIYDISRKYSYSDELEIEYDVTNLSSIDCNTNSFYGSRINVVIEIITHDNRSYVGTEYLDDSVPVGSTVEGTDIDINIRGKKPKYIRAYCAVEASTKTYK
ncbi:retroviral-like aspartic protease family protein [Saprospiraceae bacterium]|nr:retroviral-like aspartic protease family protein [Saprospiraceae bacterium]